MPTTLQIRVAPTARDQWWLRWHHLYLFHIVFVCLPEVETAKKYPWLQKLMCHQNPPEDAKSLSVGSFQGVS